MKNFTFSASLLANISCGRKGNFAHNLRLQPLDTRPGYFDYGELMHYLLKHYYINIKDGKSLSESRKIAVEKGEKAYIKLSLPVSECAMVVQNFEEYCAYYQHDKWIPKRIEEPFAFILYEDPEFEFDDDTGIRLIGEGIVDLEVEVNGETIQVDHKTVSRNREPEKLSYQFMLYNLAYGRRKLIVNDIGKQKTLKAPDRFHRHIRFYTDELLTEFKSDITLKLLRWLRDNESGLFIPDFTSCDKFNGCTFHRICEQNPSMREAIIKSYFKQSDKTFNVFDKLKED